MARQMDTDARVAMEEALREERALHRRRCAQIQEDRDSKFRQEKVRHREACAKIREEAWQS